MKVIGEHSNLVKYWQGSAEMCEFWMDYLCKPPSVDTAIIRKPFQNGFLVHLYLYLCYLYSSPVWENGNLLFGLEQTTYCPYFL